MGAPHPFRGPQKHRGAPDFPGGRALGRVRALQGNARKRASCGRSGCPSWRATGTKPAPRISHGPKDDERTPESPAGWAPGRVRAPKTHIKSARTSKGHPGLPWGHMMSTGTPHALSGTQNTRVLKNSPKGGPQDDYGAEGREDKISTGRVPVAPSNSLEGWAPAPVKAPQGNTRNTQPPVSPYGHNTHHAWWQRSATPVDRRLSCVLLC